MTDRINALTVVLDHDYRDDDVAHLVAAIQQFKGVLIVTPNVSTLDSHIAETRVRRELEGKLWDVLRPLNLLSRSTPC